MLASFNIPHLIRKWCQYFTHEDNYFEFLLVDPYYMGEKVFIVERIGRRWEVVLNSNLDAI
jgi:hypothetical protein